MIYYFAHCTFDTQLHTLHRASQSTRLPPKVFEVLWYLIAHRDRVVSKQELCEQVWRGLAISEATLESCIRAVRARVGDSGQAQQIIQTHRGYGYRFVATVQAPPAARPRLGAVLASPAWCLPAAAVQAQTAAAPSFARRQPGAVPASRPPGEPPCGTAWGPTTRTGLDRRLDAPPHASCGGHVPCPTRLRGSK